MFWSYELKYDTPLELTQGYVGAQLLWNVFDGYPLGKWKSEGWFQKRRLKFNNAKAKSQLE
jgi:hypothetical protein